MPDNDPLDASALSRLVALEADAPGFLAEICDEFEQGVIRRIVAMRAAIETDDRAALSAAAHGLRGSCGTVGAHRMAVLARGIEDVASMNLGAAARLILQLQSEYEAVRIALEAVRPVGIDTKS